MSYLIHFNKNHSPKNGQFISGDGDGDGISNDHKNQKTIGLKKNSLRSNLNYINKKTGYGRQYSKDDKLTKEEADEILKFSKEYLKKHDKGQFDPVDNTWKSIRVTLLEDLSSTDKSYVNDFVDANRDWDGVVNYRKKGLNRSVRRGVIGYVVVDTLLKWGK